VRCAAQEPTQIVVTVRASDLECPTIDSTCVRVKTTQDLSVRPMSQKAGCVTTTKIIGTFVLVPEGPPDSTARFLVATGVKGKRSDLCRFNDLDCIFAKRVTTFVPNETVRLDVMMNGACLGKTCEGEAVTCENGQCISAVVDPRPEDCTKSGTCVDAGGDSAVVVDAKPLTPCEGSACGATGGECQQDGRCSYICSAGSACDKTCPPGLSCTFTCNGPNACAKVTCTDQNEACKVTCSGGAQGNGGASCADVTLGTTTESTLDCTGNDDCRRLTCNAQCRCTRQVPTCSGSCGGNCSD
jgi:hypothetical protein